MTDFKPGWAPTEPHPLAASAMVSATMRDDEPVAELTFVDPTGEDRTVQASVNTVLSLQAQLAAFLVTAARR